MALILSDRVKVNSTTTGSGTIVLNATPPTGYQSFAVIGNANTTYYTIAGQTSAEWEVGIGTYYSANSSLSRDTILASSNANAAVVLGVGTKDVFVTYPAEKSVNYDASNLVTFTDTAFTLSNATDTTKKAKFDASGIGTGLTVTYTLPQPPASGTASTLVDLQSTQSINGAKTFTGLNQNLGSSTGNTTTNVAYGATASGNTKTVNIGTSGVSGSITNITVGSANGTTTSVLGNTAFDTNVLFVDSVNNRVGIGTTLPQYDLTVQGASNGTVVTQIYNANTNSSTFSVLQLNVGGTKYVNQSVSYSGNYFANQGVGGIVTSFTDYDSQAFRNNAGANQFVISGTASANNYVQVSGSAGAAPLIRSTGADTNVSLDHTTKGAGQYVFYTHDYTSIQYVISAVSGANNYVTVAGSAGGSPVISAAGTGTNLDIKLTPKGSGYANITSGGIKFPDATVQTTAAVNPYVGNSSIVINNINITANATIAANTNGFSIGPINTANNVTVTIASGSRWVII